MIPVNPGPSARRILGQKVYGKLSEIPSRSTWSTSSVPRNSRRVVAEALAQARPRVIWMQLGVRSDEAAEFAEESGSRW